LFDSGNGYINHSEFEAAVLRDIPTNYQENSEVMAVVHKEIDSSFDKAANSIGEVSWRRTNMHCSCCACFSAVVLWIS
jgi:hypothetical protein